METQKEERLRKGLKCIPGIIDLYMLTRDFVGLNVFVLSFLDTEKDLNILKLLLIYTECFKNNVQYTPTWIQLKTEFDERLKQLRDERISPDSRKEG